MSKFNVFSILVNNFPFIINFPLFLHSEVSIDDELNFSGVQSLISKSHIFFYQQWI